MLWFRVSKALDRSINMEIGKVFLSMAEITLSINSIETSSVEWFSLKPYWPSWSNLLHMKYADNWRKATFSNSFQIDGKIRDWFITRVRGFSRAGDVHFDNLVDMLSCPEEFFVRKDYKVLAMWFSSTREMLKEVTIFLIRYLWWVSWETLDTLLKRLGIDEKIVKFIDDFCRVVYPSTVGYYRFYTLVTVLCFT